MKTTSHADPNSIPDSDNFLAEVSPVFLISKMKNEKFKFTCVSDTTTFQALSTDGLWPQTLVIKQNKIKYNRYGQRLPIFSNESCDDLIV